MRCCSLLIVGICVVLLTACSGGGGKGDTGQGGTTPTVSLMTLYFPSGAKQAEGPGYRAPDGSVVRHGAWTDWFDTGVVHLTGIYVQGTRSASDPWVEYNSDSSVRFDWTDH